MTYQPLSEVRKSLRVEWYRCRIDHAKLREFSQRSDAQGWFQAGGHLLLYVLTGSLVYFCWSREIWPAFIVALFLHGTVASFFVGVAPHELGHGTVFRTKRLNRFFMYVFSLLSWFDPIDYATSHTYHHRYTLHPDGDREVLLPLKPTSGKTFLLQLFTVNVLTQPGRTFGKGGLLSTLWVTLRGALGQVGTGDAPINEWLEALHTDQPAEHRKSIWWARFLLLFHGALLLIAIVTGKWVLAFIIPFAPFIANWGAYFVGITQHCGLRSNVPDFRKCTRSVKLNPLAEFLYWRMNWHIEHHMYAGVPCYNLKKLHAYLADDMPEARTLRGAWREMLDTWERQQTNPDYEFDTPLPATAQSVRADTPDELESSIGELAPDGLR